MNTVEIYDLVTNTWRVGPSMQTRRDNFGAAVIGNQPYAVGGRTRNADGTIVNGTLNTLEIFDPITRQWTMGASMPTGRRSMMIGTIDNKIQVIGGEANGAATLVQNEEYNPRTETWRMLRPCIPSKVPLVDTEQPLEPLMMGTSRNRFA